MKSKCRKVNNFFGVKSNISSVSRKSRKVVRNSKRRSRRKRSKLRYYSKLNKIRVERKTDDLCSSIRVFDITDMEWVPSTGASTEVAEWHKHDQISYWKSRAMGLEYENRMLLEHLRNVYAKQIEDYSNYVKEHGEEEVKISSATSQQKEEEKKVELIQPFGKTRREEMEKLYGSKASKIMGMETAVQLNYDLHSGDPGKLPKWPCTPLKL